MKKWIKIVIYALVIVSIAVLTVIATMQKRHLNSLETQVTEQSTVIDSLLKRRMTIMDCQLHVTDKSKNVIYGRYNKGSIIMPQERRYILEVDSVNIKMK